MKRRGGTFVAARKLCNAIDAISDFTGRMASYLFIVLIGILVYEVLSRYVLRHSTSWAHELSLFLYAGLGLIGGAYALRHNMHVRTDILYVRWSPKVQAAVDIATSVLFFFFCGLLIWKGIGEAFYSLSIDENTNSVWAPPKYPIKFVLPISAFLLMLQGVAGFIRNVMFLSGRWDSR